MPPLADPGFAARVVAFFVLLLALAACAGQPPSSSPPVTTPELFSRSGEAAAPQQWWVAFDDSSLNRLVDRALGANLDLQAAYERLNQARAVRERQEAGLFPSLEARAGAERRDDGDSETDLFSAGLAAEYELDLWGRVRAQADAEAFRVAASGADYQAAVQEFATADQAAAMLRVAERLRRVAAEVFDLPLVRVGVAETLLALRRIHAPSWPAASVAPTLPQYAPTHLLLRFCTASGRADAADGSCSSSANSADRCCDVDVGRYGRG